MKIQLESNIIKYLLKNTYFINGTAYAGKSTMVKWLARQYDGICCAENYHDILSDALDPVKQPNLCYFQTMTGWGEFLMRTPEEYEAWIKGCSEEAAELEIAELLRLSAQNKRIFVDTNISLEILREISDTQHVAIMLSPMSVSVERFFDRPDPEKQFLLQQIRMSEDPDKTMKNFKACIARVNNQAHYDEFADSGFFVHKRDDKLTLQETADILARHFGLLEEAK